MPAATDVRNFTPTAPFISTSLAYSLWRATPACQDHSPIFPSSRILTSGRNLESVGGSV